MKCLSVLKNKKGFAKRGLNSPTIINTKSLRRVIKLMLSALPLIGWCSCVISPIDREYHWAGICLKTYFIYLKTKIFIQMMLMIIKYLDVRWCGSGLIAVRNGKMWIFYLELSFISEFKTLLKSKYKSFWFLILFCFTCIACEIAWATLTCIFCNVIGETFADMKFFPCAITSWVLRCHF